MVGEILAEIEGSVSGVTLVPGSGGVFEWTVNDELVFSKAAMGRYPEMKELKELNRVRTKVTKEGVEKLRKALPYCKISNP